VAVGMHRTGATVGEASEFGRVVALGTDVGAQVLGQGQVEQLDDAGRRIFDRQAERVGDLRLDVVTGTLDVELDGAAQKVLGIQVAEHDVAVGDGDRIEAAFRPAGADAVAGAVRAELDRLAVGVEAHEAASAGADRVHGDQRQRKDQAGHVGVGLDGEAALGDQRHVEAGAADVGTGDVLVAEVLAEQLGADDPADRPGDDGAGQFLGLPADRAAVRRHDAQVELGAVLLEAVADLLQRLARGFGAVGFEDGGVHPVAFLARRVVIDRGENRDVGLQLLQLFADDVAGPLLAGFVLVRLQQADDHGLGTGLDQFAGRLAHFVFAQRNDDLALDVGALGDAAGAGDRDQRLVVAMGVEVDAIFQRVAEVALQSAAHGVDLLEAAIADQADVEAFAHQDAVEHGGAGIDAGHQFRIHVIDVPAPVFERID